MVVTMMMAADRLRQILHIGELAALGGARKVRGKLGELSRRCRIARRRGGLRGGSQVCSDLRGDLRIFRWVRLLKLLELAHQLGEGRKLTIIRRLRERDRKSKRL